MQVGVKGQTPVLEGELSEQVNTEDCFWNISDGKLIEITLQKVLQKRTQKSTHLVVITRAFLSRGGLGTAALYHTAYACMRCLDSNASLSK